MRARWAAMLVAAVTAMLASAAGAAFATDPVTLGSARVLDDVGILSGPQTSDVESRLQRLPSESGMDLWVVYVDQFTDPSDAEGWANAAAEQNGLGPSQYLLAIATEGRQFYLSGDSSGPVSPEQLSTIEQQRILPALRGEDWAGAATAAADGLVAAAGGGTGAPSSGGGGFFTGVLILLVVAAAIALIVWLVVRSRRRAKKPAIAGGAPAQSELDGLDTKELVRRAASALVQTDDAIKTSEQELGFAKAQFGDAATVEFEQALAQAKSDLDRAFALKQQLDDSTPDSEAEVRGWNGQILQLLGEANKRLDEKAAAFDELRKLEQNAPEALARVQELRTKAAAEIDRADDHLRVLATSYAPQALATVADNVEQARQRIAFADEQLAAAQQAIGAGNGGQAAVGIRAAEEAVGQATLLEDAIDHLGADLAKAEADAAALVADLEADLATAAGLPDPDGRLAGIVDATRRQVDTARADLASTQRRPLATLQALEAANTQIDGVVTSIRDAQAQAQRARQQLSQSIMQAQAQVSAAEDYVMARRGAIGADARTRLAEAGSSLVHAQQLQATDPAQALQYAQRANQLAAQAIQFAQNDVGAFQGGGMFGGGGGGGGGSNGMLGAVLGGIVINSLLSGGGGRSSGGGGAFGGGGGARRSGGGYSPGSFGGGGTRARRGGGRF